MAVQDVGVRAVLENLTPFLAGTAAMDRSLNNLNRSTTNVARGASLAQPALLALAGAATAVGAAVAASVVQAARFEHAMAGIQAVSNASASDMKALTEAALTAGKQFGFTATSVAGAEEALIKAGVSISDVLGGALPAALTLAAAGSIDVQTAAEIASNALNQFSLKGSDMAHVADLIAGAANASAIDVKDMGLSLQQAGAVAALAGQDIDSTTTAIAVLGSAGIKSSDAGTSLKTMLQNLQPQSKNAAELMELLGLRTEEGANAFFDAEGKAKSFKDIAGVLQKALGGLTEQQKLATLSIIFGSDASRAAAILAREGAAGFDEMADAMGRVTAEDVAGKRLDSLIGDLQKLETALSGVATQAGTQTTPQVRDLIQALTRLVENVTPNVLIAVSNIASGLTGIAQFAAAATTSVDSLGKALALLGPLTPVLSGIGSALQLGSAIFEPSQRGTTTTTGAGITDIAAGLKDAQARAKALARPLQDFSDLQAATDGTKKFAAVTGQASDEALRLRKQVDGLLNSFVSDKGGGLKGAAEDVRTEFEKLGGSFDIIRRAGDDLKLSQETVDKAILSVGGSILDTSPIVEGYGATMNRLSAQFAAAGLNGQEVVAAILAQQAAAKARAEAEKAAAEAERKAEEDRRKAEEERKRAEEEAKRRREQALAAIQGQSARDVLGGIRGRGAGTGEQAAADFDAAVAGFERLNTAGMDTNVAFEVMETRLGRLSAAFGVLNGDDLASAGATTDAIRKLKAAFDAGEIGAEEFLQGLKSYTPELSRLAGEVDKLWEAWQKEAEAEKEALKADRLEIYQSALRNQRAAFEVENQKIIDGWNKRAEAQRRVLDIEIALARAQMSAGEREAARKLENRINRENIASAFAAAALTPEDEFGANGPANLAALATLAQQFGISVADLVDFATKSGINVTANTAMIPSRPQLATLPVGSGGSTTVNRNVTYDVTANYSNPQEPQALRYDLQTAAMLAGR